MKTYSLKVAYNGAPFHGFARQPGNLTVQGDIENALGLIFHGEIPTVCAGRTDAGVHARCQVISFDLSDDAMEDRSETSLLRSLNALTHDTVILSDFRERAEGFSARFDAKAREYRYFIYDKVAPPLFMYDFSWHVSNELDVEAMESASRCLIGEHDFKSFCMAASAKGKHTFRHIDEISIFSESVMSEELLVVKIVGNAFLHSMVRAIVGTLVAVGKGKREPEWVSAVLEARDRTAAGENAPAHGLVLWDVKY